MLTAERTYQGTGLVPVIEPEFARSIPIGIAPGASYLKGTVMAEVTGTGTAVDEVQTLTPTGTISGGSFTLTTADGQITAAIAYSATAADIQAALEPILGVGNVVCAGGPIATVAVTVTFTAMCGGLNIPMLVVTNSLTGSSPVVTPTQTTQGKPAGGYFVPYLTGQSDGSQLPKGLLIDDCTADNFGKVTLGRQQGGGDFGSKTFNASIWIRGVFRCSDLIGLDSGGITAGIWKIVSGNPTILTLPTTWLRIG